MTTSDSTDPEAWISADVLALPVMPGALTAADARDLLGKKDPLILDVGANRGQTVLDLMLTIPGATVHAFEPDPRAAAIFRRCLDHPRIHLYECAVGAVNGTVVFHQSSGSRNADEGPEDWDQSGSIRKPHKHLVLNPWVKFERNIEVPIVTLDAWAEQNAVTHVDLVWADVQGAESDLIQGASRLLKSVRYFYTEYSNVEMYQGQVDLAGLAQLLPEFELVRRYQWDALFRNRLLA